MEINFFQILFQIVNFTILLFLLKKFLYQPILNILEQRSKKIHEGLEAAEKSIEEREKLEKQKKRILVEAEKDATKILEGSRLQAKRLEKQLNQKVEKSAEKKLNKAEGLAKSRLLEMEQELQRKFATTVVKTTQALLQDSIDTKQQRIIVKNQIKKLRNIKFSA